MVEKDYKITISSDPDNIVEVENFIDQIKETVNIGDDIYGNIMISLTEAVNNAIFHGNENDISKSVEVTCRKDGQTLSFIVSDQGKGFDFNNLPDPTDPENLEKLTGRGVFLMKQLSDLLIYSNGGSTVEMQFKV
jgi:serine/threonine-protein kinase RsbW